jgi:sulfite exporter TauE/SafE
MYSFIVLGLVPGTNLQITFQGWLLILTAALLLILTLRAGMQQLRSFVSTTDQLHQPVHARALHPRLF